MSHDREWERVVALFEEALQHTGEARERFLDEATKGDAALRARIEAMLRADAAPHPLLDASPRTFASAVALTTDADPADAPGPAGATGTGAASTDAAGAIGTNTTTTAGFEGRRIGPYTIVRELGRGGMGTVYLAERDDVRKRVALKLVAGATPERVQRFMVERIVLARLEHPGIARLHDAGVTPDGTPWLAMEYVDGRPIDAWCDERRADVDARLDLFGRACDAVAYAHRHLVVHRDLKPSNVLVTETGDVKLLDFGIAKLLDESAGDALTRTGLSPLTPRYASPEQVAGGPITTATDVYQLGVMLNELLGGRPLRGDLEAIVNMALRPEPERRYASAQQLAEDIRRYRTGQPIIARPDSFGYRASKFVRRNRVAVVAAGVVALALVAATAGTTWQARVAARAAEIAAAERDRAALERETAEQVAAFLVDLFEASDPGQALGREVTARELLERGASRLGEQGELAGQPTVRAELLHVLGQVYTNLGWRAEAREFLEQALALRRQHLEPGDPELAESLMELGNLEIYDGRPEAARPLFDEGLALLRASPDTAVTSTIATALNGLAAVHLANAQLDTAETLLREAVALRTGRQDEAELLAQNLNALGVVLSRGGKNTAADSFYTAALAIQRQLLAPNHPDLARSINNLGIVKQRTGDAAAAESHFREALDIWRPVLGRHPDVAVALHNIAASLEAQAKLQEAEAAYRESLALKRELIQGDHPTLTSTLNNLGLVLVALGRSDEAEPLLHESLAMRRRIHGEDHPDVARAYQNLADLHERTGRLAQAESGYQRALDIRRRTLPPGHRETLTSAFTLARVEQALGDAAAAAALLDEVIETATPLLPADDRLLVEATRLRATLPGESARP